MTEMFVEAWPPMIWISDLAPDDDDDDDSTAIFAQKFNLQTSNEVSYI